MKSSELEGWWVVEWHPRGSVSFGRMQDVIERNHRAFLSGGTEGRVMLGLLPTMQDAQEYVRQLKREKRVVEPEVQSGLPCGED